MTKAEQIAQLLSIPSTDVIVENDSIARHKDREWTADEQELIEHVFYSDEKKELKEIENALKEEAKALKAENKLLRDRIADATDFTDLKTKLTKVKDSETTPEKWSDKTRYLRGQYVEFKGDVFLVLEDHDSDKAKTPDITTEWYRANP